MTDKISSWSAPPDSRAAPLADERLNAHQQFGRMQRSPTPSSPTTAWSSAQVRAACWSPACYPQGKDDYFVGRRSSFEILLYQMIRSRMVGL